MLTLRRSQTFWCVGALVYFLCIYAATIYYYKTAGDAPDLIAALHHDWIFTPLIGAFLPGSLPIEIVSFIGGIIFYGCLGILLGSLQFRGHKYAGSRGIFFAILCSMVGYTIGATIGGHPAAFIVVNPPIFFVVGYFLGKATFRTKNNDNELIKEKDSVQQ